MHCINYCISPQLTLFYFNMAIYNASVIFDAQWMTRRMDIVLAHNCIYFIIYFWQSLFDFA